MERKWAEIKACCRSERLDAVAAIMSRVDPSLVIEDNREIGPDPVYGELLDEKILNADRAHGSVALYLPENSDKLPDAVSYLRDRFAALDSDIVLTVSGHDASEWENSWKKYYHVQRIGKIVICPAWEDCTLRDGEQLIKMDPGMAFGTGTHETTRLVIAMLQHYMFPGAQLLDIGTGSGILSICASKLGAASCHAYDLDPDAVRIAAENAQKNDIRNMACGVSDLLKNVERPEGGYTLVTANIVADILVRLLPELPAFTAPGAPVILSGIISDAEPEVADCLARCAYRILERRTEGDWVCLAVAHD